MHNNDPCNENALTTSIL